VISYPVESLDCRANKFCQLLSFIPTTLALLILLQSFGFSSQLTPVSLPIVFETNMGQVPPAYQFLSRHGGVEALFSSSGVDLFLPQSDHSGPSISFRLLGARVDVVPEGKDLLPSKSNYLLGNDPSRWIHGVSNHSQVIYPEIYPGIDLVFRGSGDDLEHDFRISPGADPAKIRFSIGGGHAISVDASGDLGVSLTSGQLVFHKPLAYQESTHGREPVESSFVLNFDNTVQFRLGAYDGTRELVIDPVFGFSTYLASSSSDTPTAVTTDSSGNIYVTGYTSTGFPIVNGVQPVIAGTNDAYVAELDPTGHTLLYSTYLGGSEGNYAAAIALDAKGNIIVAGTSGSNDFPHAGSVPKLTCQINASCFFVASLTPDGSAFNYSGLIGGLVGDYATNQGRLAVDATGNAYLADITDDPHFDITPGTLSKKVPGYPYDSTFVLKVSPTGALVYSTIIPGTASENPSPYNNVFFPNGIAVDSNGQATIAGTAGLGLPTTAGVIAPNFPNKYVNVENPTAGFVLQLNPTASAINYATYVPGTDDIGGFAVDSKGNSYLAGATSETNLPVSKNAYQKTISEGPEGEYFSGFILELDGMGKTVLAATYLDGMSGEGSGFTGTALDSASNVYVGGWTGASDFPMQNPFTTEWEFSGSDSDMVLAEMNPDLSALLFGSFLNSTDQTLPGSTFSALTVDNQNNLIVTGSTTTTDFPTTQDAFETVPPNQATHGFVSKIDMATPAPSVCLDTWNVNLGLIPAKKSGTQIVHLTNCGNSPLTLTSLISSAATVRATDTCGTIQPGIVCPVSVTFKPVNSSQVNGTITLSDNAVISPQIFSFSGQGSAPQVSPNSGSYNFGHLLVNTTGAGNQIFFQNIGNLPLVFSSVTTDGDFSITQNLCQGATDYCSVTVAFAPTASGIRTGTLFVNSNDPVYPKARLSLEGIGDTVYPVPVISYLSSPSFQIKNGAVSVQVSGDYFYPASVIEVNGKPQTTTYASGQQLQATFESGVTNAIGEISLTVSNPAPGGGSSIPVVLTRYEVLNVDAAFLTTVPGSKFLYAAIPSSSPTNPNTVMPINPATGALGKPIPVGQNPTLLAASSDGSYLFVIADQDQTVQRINMSTLAVDETFPFPPNNTDCCGPLSATDLHGIPGSPEEVVLALDIPGYGFGEMALYNNSGLVNYVPTTAEGLVDFSSFTYVGDSLTIYSLPFTNAQVSYFSIVTIGATGLELPPPAGGNYIVNNTVGSQVVSDGTLLYTNSGQVWSPATQTQVASFPVTTYGGSPMALDLPSGHIFLVGSQPYGGDSDSIVLSAYNEKSLGITGTVAFPQVEALSVSSLVRWGSDGFAFLGQGPFPPFVQAVYLLTSSLANPLKSNAVPVLDSIDPSSLSEGNQGFQLTVNGQKFSESAVINWNGTPLQTTYVASTVLTAVVPASDLANSGSSSITVTNPLPGGGTSKPIQFAISPLVPLLSFSSATLSFPAESVGTASPVQTVAVENPGTAPLSISKIAITGADAGSFHETNNCGKSAAPGANCLISITFKPTSTGSLTAFVSVTDDATGSPQSVSLVGTGK
jgi:hypothetical protein